MYKNISKVNVPVGAHLPVLARFSTFFMKLKTLQYIFCVKGIRIVEHKFIIHYLLKVISVSVYCNIITNKIFSHVRIIIHKMTVLFFHAVNLFLDLSENINLKEKNLKLSMYIIDRPNTYYFLYHLR